MKKNTINFIIRILISCIILGFLIYKIKIINLKENLCNFNPLFYILTIIVLFTHQYIWSYTWKTALSTKKIYVKQKDIFKAVLTSHFFGTFLPSALGPDIILTFNVGRSLPEKEHAPSSLLFIRLMNITGMLLLSGVVLLFIAHTFALKQILVLTWLLSLSIWVLYWMAIHPKSRRLMEKITSRYKWLGFIYKIFHSFSTFGLNKNTSLKVWLLGLCMAFLKVTIDYSIARSLGIHIPYIWFLGLVPSISIITLLPITIAGLGLREGAYIFFFSLMGVPDAKSLSISLMLFTLNIILCILGGILYLIHGAHVKHKTL